MSAPDQPTAACQERFETISLPRELRDKVYRELLVPDKMRNPRVRWSTFQLQPAVLRVSKQTNAEAKKILYGENTWILFEIHSSDFLETLGTPSDYCADMTYIESFPDQPALKVGIHGPNLSNVTVYNTTSDDTTSDDSNRKLLVARCDLYGFFTEIVIPAVRYLSKDVWESLDFDLHFCGCDRKEESSLVEFFQNIRGAGKVSVSGTSVSSTGQELATRMMTPFANIDELYEMISIYKARGDEYFAALKYQKALDTYYQGFKYLEKMIFLHPEEWLEGSLGGATPFNVQRLEYKDYGLRFAWGLCSLELPHDTPDERDMFPDPSPYEYYPVYEGFDKIVHLMERGCFKQGMELILSILRESPAHQRVDKEIDHMEVQLRSVVPKGPSIFRMDEGRARAYRGIQ